MHPRQKRPIMISLLLFFSNNIIHKSIVIFFMIYTNMKTWRTLLNCFERKTNSTIMYIIYTYT